MALIKCPECGTEVSDKAEKCPKCAYPLNPGINISEVKNNVNVINLSEKTKLSTSQLFWDANEHYIYTEKKFTLITKFDTIHGEGFESNEDLTKVNMKSISGTIYVNDN